MTVNRAPAPSKGIPAPDPALLTVNLYGQKPNPIPPFQENDQRELPLTAEEAEYFLKKARQAKYAQAMQANYAARTKRPEFATQLTAEQYLALFKARADWHVQHEDDAKPEFYITDENREQIWQLCLYFAHDRRFETEYGLSLGKGLLLRGNVGCGKSTILQMFHSNHRQSYTLVPCRDITDAFEAEGVAAIAPYYGMLPAKPELSWGQSQLGVVFDDLGTENYQAANYKNGRNCLADIICNRYDKRHTLTQGATHITTNLLWDEILDIYKDRAESRLIGGYNDIVFPSHARDWRKHAHA